MSGGNLTNSANITGAVSVTATGTLSGSGTVGAVTVTDGTLTLGGNKTASSWALSGGSLNSGTRTVSGTITVNNNATITGTGTIENLVLAANTLTLGANTTLSAATFSGGSLDLSTYTLNINANFSVTGNTTITASSAGFIDCNGNTLTINGGNLTLDKVELLIDKLTFSSANDIITSNDALLSFDNSNGHAVNNAATDRHVNGTIRVYLSNGNTTVNTYPLGNGSYYAPLSVTPTGKDSSGTNLSSVSGNYGTHYITMKYVGSKYTTTTIDNTIAGASGSEYWQITRSSSKPAATYKFYMNTTGSTYGKTSVSNSSNISTDLTLAEYNTVSGKWGKLNATYASQTGYITLTTTAAISANSVFTFGSTNGRTPFVTPLPVSLIDFSAKANDNNIEIKWSTASEKDNAAFVVEKSIDGQVWSAIGTVKGAKTSNIVNNYGLVDFKAVAGVQYYRLKQIDVDGTVNYSKAIAVNFSKASTLNVNLFPNPAKDALNITTENNASGEVNIQILNSMGETVYNQVVQAGLVQTIDIASFIPGVYYVTVIAEGESKIIRLLKN